MLPQKLAFIDVETTGLSITHDRIIEIGIVRVEKNKVVEKFTTLVNPLVHISPTITHITGIRKEDLEDAPLFEDVKEKVKELLEDCVFVAHNVRFDYGFIKNEFRRTGSNFSSKMLCTAKLSRTIFPQYQHHNLDAIIERFGFTCKSRHRAFDDAFILWEFYKALKKQIPKNILETAVAAHMGKPSLPVGLAQEELDKLHDVPGVYIFYSENGSPLYVGKSKNLRTRVLSHFTSDHLSSKEMSVSRQIKHIETILTAGELGALVKESELVKKLQPLYNRKLRIKQRLTVLTHTQNSDSFETVIMEELDESALHHSENIIGIFTSQKQAKDFLISLALAYNLCEKLLGLEKTKGSCFAYRLKKCFGACIKEENPLKYNMRFFEAFSNQKLKKWPFKGPVVITEKNIDSNLEEKLIVNRWCILKHDQDNMHFDVDIYKILVRYLEQKENLAKVHVLSQNELLSAEL